jgi:hypothetical protein
MISTKPFNKHLMGIYILIFLLLICLFFIYLNCGSESKPTNGDQPGKPLQVSMPLEGAFENIQLVANQTTYVEASLEVPPDLGIIEEAEIDIPGSAQYFNLSYSQASFKLDNLFTLLSGTASAQVIIRVGSDPATVCEQGVEYGPYTITPTSLENQQPDKIALGQSTLQILNTGSVQICMEILSTVDATFSIDQLEAGVAEGNCGTPTDFSGRWAGTYECGNSCTGESFGDTVEIVVTQDGNNAYYIDLMNETYSGTICGNLFRFEHIGEEFIERGTLILTDENHATKRSTWRGTSPPYCFGSCVDVLTRVVEE